MFTLLKKETCNMQLIMYSDDFANDFLIIHFLKFVFLDVTLYLTSVIP